MPQLSGFVAGRRGFSARDVNYRIALLRDALADMDDAERKKFTSQSVHGNNPGGAVFSGIEKATGLKFSTSLGDAIKRYDDTVLENKPAEEIRSGVGFGIQPAQEFPGEAVPKEVTFSLAERSYLPDHRRRLDQAGILTDSSHRLPKEGARARADALHQELLADDAATKIQAVFRGHKSRTAPSVAIPIDATVVATEPVSVSVSAPAPVPVPDERGQGDNLAESARALQDRIAGRTGQSAKELQAAVARTIKREAENITPPPSSPGTKPIGGQSTRRG